MDQRTPLPEPTTERRLATIVAADVAGYSARTEADEDAATAEIAALARLVAATAAQYGGRLFNSAGDGFMLEFATVSGALDAAEALAAQSPSPLRVGVHLGEVRVTANGDLLGHGVNVAARIRGLAAPGGVVASEDVRRAIRGPLAARLTPCGLARLDKMDEAIRVYALGRSGIAARARSPSRRIALGAAALGVTGLGVAALGAGGAKLAPILASRMFQPRPSGEPMVAVLPFDNLSPETRLGYLADGLAEDILNGLTRAGGLRVVARTSSFGFRGAGKADAGRTLGADYLLDGSVLRDGAKLRVNAHLSQVASRQTLWSQTYEGDLGEGPALGERIAADVAAKLNVRPADASLRQSIDPVAYDLYQRARADRTFSVESLSQSAALLRAAVERAPNFPDAWFELAMVYQHLQGLQPIEEQVKAGQAGLAAARRAAALDPRNGAAVGIAQVLTPTFGRWSEIDEGLARGLAISPNEPNLLNLRARFLLNTGRVRAALEFARSSRALSPLDLGFNHILALALVWLEQFDEAGAVLDQMQARWPGQLAPFWDRVWLLLGAGREREAAAWVADDARRPPDLEEEVDVLTRAFPAMAGGSAAERRAAGRACIALARNGLGYAANAIVYLARLGLDDEAVDMARGVYLKEGPVRIDHRVQFVGNSRFPARGETDPMFLFHPALKRLRRSGRLDPVFQGIGLPALWRRSGGPDV